MIDFAKSIPPTDLLNLVLVGITIIFVGWIAMAIERWLFDRVFISKPTYSLIILGITLALAGTATWLWSFAL